MVLAKSAETQSREHAPDFHPYIDFVARFTCVAECAKPGCQEHTVVSGSAYCEPGFDEEGREQPTDHLVPVCIHPPPPIITIPRRCPKDLRVELNSAFGLFWADQRSAANRVRAAVEILLTHLGVKRFSNKKGRRFRINLHDRIELFRRNEPDLGAALLAIKWIGNEGSHPGGVTKDDLLDAFELISHVLDETYVSNRSRLSKLAKEINRRKKPRSTRKKKKK